MNKIIESIFYASVIGISSSIIMMALSFFLLWDFTFFFVRFYSIVAIIVTIGIFFILYDNDVNVVNDEVKG